MALLGLAGWASAHEVEHRVGTTQALVVELRYPGGGPFAFASYEVYRDGAKVPYQVGKSDAEGRIALVSSDPAAFRIKAFSADGHGVDLHVRAAGAALEVYPGAAPDERLLRIALGVMILLGLFGALRLFVPRRGG